MIRNTVQTVFKNLIFFFVYQYASGTRWSQVSQPLFPSDLSQTSHKGSSRDLWQKYRASIGLCHWKEEMLTAIHSSISLLNGHVPGKEYLVDLASDVLPILLCQGDNLITRWQLIEEQQFLSNIRMQLRMGAGQFKPMYPHIPFDQACFLRCICLFNLIVREMK